jgi:hypothetical protein
VKAIALTTSNRAIRWLSAAAAGLIVVQLLLLQQPDYARPHRRSQLRQAGPLRRLRARSPSSSGSPPPRAGRSSSGRSSSSSGAIDESHQLDMPGRTASIADLAADGAGAAASLLVLNSLNQRKG